MAPLSSGMVQQLEDSITRVIAHFNQTRTPENRYVPILVSAVLGAVLGIVPSLITLHAQAAMQERQAVLERKIRIHTEFAQVIYGDSMKFLAKEYAFELLVRRTSDGANATPKERQEITDEAKGFQEDFLDLIGKINVNISSVNSTFDTNIEMIDLSKTAYASDNPSEKNASTVMMLIEIRNNTLQIIDNLQRRIQLLRISIQK
jgi:hypothetical protein